MVIGLTGNIACGKSTVLAELDRLGAATIDADSVYHELIEPGKPLWAKLLKRFGNGIALPDGRIDRQALGRIVFSDPAALADLERITHPAIREEVLRQVRTSTRPVVAVAAIKLIEGGWQDICDSIWLVTCRPEQQRQRLIDSRGLSPTDADARLAAQPAVEPKMSIADVVIDNSGTIEATRDQVRNAWGRTILPRMATGPLSA